MPILRVHHNKDNPYFMLNRRAVEDDRISFKAVGILTYLLSKPDHWVVREEDLAKRHTEGTTAVRSGLKELYDAGYLLKEYPRNEKGQVAGTVIHVYEMPVEEMRDSGYYRDVGFPHLGDSSGESDENRNPDKPSHGKPTSRSTTPIVNTDSLVSNEELVSDEEEIILSDGENAADDESPSALNSKYSKYLFPDKKGTQDIPEEDRYLKACRKFMEVLLEKRKIFRQVNLQKWAAEFRKWHAVSKVLPSEFKAVMEWYSKNIDEEFVPVAYSMGTFCEKYTSIKAAMHRASVGQKGTDQARKDKIARIVELSRRSRATEAPVPFDYNPQTLEEAIGVN